MRQTALLLVLAAVFMAVGYRTAVAQSNPRLNASEPSWQLPTDAQLWVNGPPLSSEALSGKGVILYFFEEECPRCSAFWPKLQTLSESYADKPVVFIAINSGTAPGELQRYIRRQKVKWPLIMDLDRSLEQSMGVTRIELGRGVRQMDNVNHVIAITPDGKLNNTTAQQLPAAVEQVLQGAEWRVDPKTIPPALQQAWRWVEIGAYPKAARDISRAAEHHDERIQAGGEALLNAVNADVAADQKSVDRARKKKELWEAYKLLDTMRYRYEGYEAQQKIDEQLEKLGESSAVEAEVRARRTLEKAMRTASKGTDGARRRALGMLEKLVEKDPDTEAGENARELLNQQETQR